jgi:hypothetical protein
MRILAVTEYKYPMCFWNDSCEFLSSSLIQLVSMNSFYVLVKDVLFPHRTLPPQ